MIQLFHLCSDRADLDLLALVRFECIGLKSSIEVHAPVNLHHGHSCQYLRISDLRLPECDMCHSLPGTGEDAHKVERRSLSACCDV